jgi:hypothetical protein
VGVFAAKMSDSIDARVKRGQESWTYIYMVLGFAITIEGTIVSMIEPLRFPWNLVVYALVAITTFRLFLFSGWVHNKLIGLKIRYESTAR